MSFNLTKKQMYARIKDVTRRLGWDFLKAGDIVMACEKCQGLKKGEKIVRIYPIKIISVTNQPLYYITKEEVKREGFPYMTADEFISMFTKEMKCHWTQKVNRIEFKEYKDKALQGSKS
jgi:hypothetical protein